MNSVKIAIVFALTFSAFNSQAQTLNWNGRATAKQLISFQTGIEYSSYFGVAYARRINSHKPIWLKGQFSIPGGTILLDDFKTRLGAEICLFKASRFAGSASVFGLYRRYQNNLVRLQNFGTTLNASVGYYPSKWFLAVTAAFDKAIVTHFKHSAEYKNDYNPQTADGWYEPSSGGNFLYGISTGFSQRRFDFTLNLGKIVTQDFKTSPLLPLYAEFGINYQF